jgi:hypothetical protein
VSYIIVIVQVLQLTAYTKFFVEDVVDVLKDSKSLIQNHA